MTRASVALLPALLLVAACSSGGDGRTELVVLAAASLGDAFTELEVPFERAHDDIDVVFSFGGSSALVEQVNRGGPGDVLVTADEITMDRVDGAGPSTVIARNRLAILVERGNPQGIDELDDLARAGTVVVLCAPEVPCGRLAEQALADAGIDVAPASFEESVKGVVAKLALGEADAGIGYVTDATGAEVDAVAFDANVEAVYPVAALPGSDDDAAAAWIEFVTGDDAQAVLREHGFLEP